MFGTRNWSRNVRTQVGLYFEVAEGNQYLYSGGNRYSFVYSGDVNRDGGTGNDLIYIPRSQDEIKFGTRQDGATPQQQWEEFNAFIEQDPYLSKHRGEIAERSGALNPWYHTVDLRILQDFGFGSGTTRHGFQLSLDFLNLTNLISSDWGVRKVASVAATSPLSFADPAVPFDSEGDPVFNFSGATETYVPDPGIYSRWRIQVGLRYFIN